MSDEHRHHFKPVAGRKHDDGTPIRGVRRCACGAEVVGEAPLGINIEVVRASHNFNQALTRAFSDIARAMRR